MLTRFHGRDPAREVVLPETSPETLMKHILAIYPAPGVAGRRNIKMKRVPAGQAYFNPNEISYIVLRPINVPRSSDWSKRIGEFIDHEDLHYIGGILRELEQEGHPASTVNLDIVDDDNQEKSSSSSSVPTGRALSVSLRNDSIEKFENIQRWLNSSATADAIYDYPN